MWHQVTHPLFPDAPLVRREDRKSGLVFWQYKGRTFVCGLFAFASTHGLPLEFQVQWANQSGLVPCLDQYVLDAIQAGVSASKARAVAAEARFLAARAD